MIFLWGGEDFFNNFWYWNSSGLSNIFIIIFFFYDVISGEFLLLLRFSKNTAELDFKDRQNYLKSLR